MSYKIKSALYFSSFVLALVIYYADGNFDTVQTVELAQNDLETVLTIDDLHQKTMRK